MTLINNVKYNYIFLIDYECYIIIIRYCYHDDRCIPGMRPLSAI